MVRVLLIAMALSAGLSAASFLPLKATDRDVREVHVTWVKEDTAAECYRLTAQDAYGCVVFEKDTCTIYAPKPGGQDDVHGMEVLGHELLHCFIGYWH